MSDVSRVEILAAPPLTVPPARASLKSADRLAPDQPAARGIDMYTWLAIAIVAVGALLRWYTIVKFTWDQDELYTIQEARDLFQTKLPPGINARPLYYLLQHPLLSLLPQTTVMLRLLPFAFGTLGLWVTWL